MPANLTHQYLKAEQAYRRSATPDEELQHLQIMLRELPKHKGTDKLHADLKQKISKLKRDLTSGPRSGGRGHGAKIPRQGAGRVVVIGGPNAGKSQFIRSVTRAEPEVGRYPFTTREPAPAMMPFEDVMVQLIDTPPVTADYLHSALQGLIRGADLVLLLSDLGTDDGIEQFQDVLERFQATKTGLAQTTYLDEHDVGQSHTTTFVVHNKIDLPDADDRLAMLHEFCSLDFREFRIAAGDSGNPQVGEMDLLKQAVFEALDVVRVYTKAPSAKHPDYDKPFTVRRGGTLLDIAELIHQDVAKNLKSAKVWGNEMHRGTSVKPDYVLRDKDVVELHVH